MSFRYLCYQKQLTEFALNEAWTDLIPLNVTFSGVTKIFKALWNSVRLGPHLICALNNGTKNSLKNL